MARQNNRAPRDLYKEIADRILASLEGGDVAPWQRPWNPSPLGSTPFNAVSKRPYRGVNVWLTMLTAWSRGYALPMWLTFKQANEIAAKAARKAGHKVEKNRRGQFVFAEGERKGLSVGGIRAGQNKANDAGATGVVFWKPVKSRRENEAGEMEARSFLVMRSYQVFNVQQCDAAVREYLLPGAVFDEESGALISMPESATEFAPLEACEEICEGWTDVPVNHGGNQAYYQPSTDQIQLPERDQFKSPEEYYTTRFHEMAHATGHPSRLARFKVGQHRAVHTYAEEELVAEFTACFLAGEAGIVRTVEQNSTAYLRAWASRIREDKRIVVRAAQRAQKAADLILGRQAVAESSDEQEASQAA